MHIHTHTHTHTHYKLKTCVLHIPGSMFLPTSPRTPAITSILCTFPQAVQANSETVADGRRQVRPRHFQFKYD